MEQIRADAEQKAGETVAAAEREAEALLEKAAQAAEAEAAEREASGAAEAEGIRRHAESAAVFSRRRTLLAAKQSAIRDAVAAAKSQLHGLSDGEYFAVLARLAQKYAADGDAEMRLNAADLARLPAGFEDRLNKAVGRGHITVSKTPCDLPDGFLLVYGGIDVNCTFDALFEAEADALQDIAGGLLFR
ncbi:MAG: V-type ATP synthase subunit E family protein [Acutalibacteraceae bacterium]